MNSQITGGARPAAYPAALALAIGLMLPVAACAQPRQLPDPADPQAKVPAFHYLGSLSRYRSLQEAPIGSWQQANERTRQAGGWRAYAREQVPADDKGQAGKQPGGHQHGAR